MTEKAAGTPVLRSVGAAVALSLLLIMAGHAVAAGPGPQSAPVATDTAQDYEDAKGEALDAYIAGRLITAYALSEHLSPYPLEVQVTDGRVLLSGVVANAVQRDLAIEIARGIEQARDVRSRIKVDPGVRATAAPERSRFAQKFSDAGITARIKSRLLLNGSTDGLAIDVDTQQRAVQLSGEVELPEESALAEQIAVNTRGVRRVENRLAVVRRNRTGSIGPAAGGAW